MQAEEKAMHRVYKRNNMPSRKPLPSVGLPRRKVLRKGQLPAKVKRQLLAAVEQMKASTAKLKDMADANSNSPVDPGDSGSADNATAHVSEASC